MRVLEQFDKSLSIQITYDVVCSYGQLIACVKLG